MNLSLSSLLSAVAAPPPGAAVAGAVPGATSANAGFAALLAQLGADARAAGAPLAADTPAVPATGDLATLLQQLVEAGLRMPANAAPSASPAQQTAPQPTLNSLLDALRTFVPAQAEAATAALDADAPESGADEPEVSAEAADLAALPPALLALLHQLGLVQARESVSVAAAAASPATTAASAPPLAPSLPPQPLVAAPKPQAQPATLDAAPALAAAPQAMQEPMVQNGAALPQATRELLELMTPPTGAAPAEPPAFSLPLAQAAAASGSAPHAAPATPVASTGTLLLAQPLDTPPWRVEFGQQLAQVALRQGDQRVSLQLHPSELGPLTVELRVRDGQADIQFLSAYQQVRSAVNEALPQLREALSQQGIALGQANVGSQERQEPWRREHGDDPAPEAPLHAGAPQGAAPAMPAAGTRAAANGRVNLYV